MILTNAQKRALLRASESTDWCTKAHPRTMFTLIQKGLATYSSGFGRKFGAIVELTEQGKQALSELKKAVQAYE